MTNECVNSELTCPYRHILFKYDVTFTAVQKPPKFYSQQRYLVKAKVPYGVLV